MGFQEYMLDFFKLTCINLVRSNSADGFDQSVNSDGAIVTIISTTRRREIVISKQVAQNFNWRVSMNRGSVLLTTC